jgi:hypothetical protein
MPDKSATLSVSTGVTQADAALRDITDRFETTFSGRTRAFYVIGRFVEGTAVPLSDLDCFIIFKRSFAGGSKTRLMESASNVP